MVGWSNVTDFVSDYDNHLGSERSVTIGAYNYSFGKNAIIVGENNNIAAIYEGPYLAEARSCTALFGYGLISRHHNCTIVGMNNVSNVVAGQSSPLFVVGNGSSTSNRSNAFEVRDNGDIIISKPQGDISMGIYGD